MNAADKGVCLLSIRVSAVPSERLTGLMLQAQHNVKEF
jgi:hypothetical protein